MQPHCSRKRAGNCMRRTFSRICLCRMALTWNLAGLPQTSLANPSRAQEMVRHCTILRLEARTLVSLSRVSKTVTPRHRDSPYFDERKDPRCTGDSNTESQDCQMVSQLAKHRRNIQVPTTVQQTSNPNRAGA